MLFPLGCFSHSLNSRTYNIAIETSPYTCEVHRTIRQQERDLIKNHFGTVVHKRLYLFGEKRRNPEHDINVNEVNCYDFTGSGNSSEVNFYCHCLQYMFNFMSNESS